VCPFAQIREDKTIRCVLVHDHMLLRQGLRRLLEDEPDMRVVDEASSAAEALPRISQHRPEVVIADAQIFDGAAEQTERIILQESPNSKVFFLTQQTGNPEADRPVPSGIPVKETSAEALVEMVRKTVTPEATAPREVRAREATEFPLEEVVPRKRVLTAREREVLKLLAEGKTVRSAAGVLGLSAKTVDAHKFNLMRKLGIHNKAELVMWAIQKRVVKLPASF
jgi:DNA-binding NarL/FixJ family response regulator